MIQTAKKLLTLLTPLTVPANEAPKIPEVREVFAELVAADEEFGNLEVRDGLISVTTDRIVLDDVDFGPFEIRLSNNSFTVVATDPHESNVNFDVTHPHVSADQLCAGWGAEPIAAALTEGRLCDFFMVIRQVLETYNAESAYVAAQQLGRRQLRRLRLSGQRSEHLGLRVLWRLPV